MIPVALMWKIGGAVAIPALIGLGGLWLHNKVWEDGYDQKTLEVQAAVAQTLADHIAELDKKRIQHDKDTATIDSLTATLSRVRVRFPHPQTCSDGATGATGSAGRDGGMVHSPVDKIFADLQSEVGILISRCDRLNSDSARANP